mgnify:CR=1 FL=1
MTEEIKVGTIVRSWATDFLKEYSTGIVIRVGQTVQDDLPRFLEILWDDGQVAGEFEDELEVVLL